MSLSQFFDTIICIQTPCHSPPLTSRAKGRSKPADQNQHTLPLWHQGQRVDQNQHTPPFLLMWTKHSADLICAEVAKLPLSSCWIFFNEVHDSMIFLSPKDSYLHQISNQVDLHIRLKYPTKWVYTFQLSYPTKWVYKNWQVLTWLNIAIYIMSLNKTFTPNYKNNFKTNTRKSSRKRTYFRINIMPTMHYTQQGQCSPWICATKQSFQKTKAPP